MKNMKTKPFLKAAAIALSIATISGISATPFTSTAVAGITIGDKDHDAKAIKIIEASITALGGRDKLSEIRYVKQVGSINIPMAGIEGTIETFISSPGKALITMDFPMMGKTNQGLVDGVAWSSDAMNGPRLIPNEEAIDLIKQSNLQYTLNYIENNTTIKYVGETSFAGQKAHEIHLIDNDGNESTDYYSAESKYQIGSIAKAQTPMGEIEAQTIMGDYKELGGYIQPTMITQKVGTTDILITITDASYEKIEDSIFDLPAAIKALIKATEAKEKAAP